MFLAFFEKLGVEVCLSPQTNQKIFNDGIALSIDESCLSVKIFMGHVNYLVGKCDKIFIPRMESFGMGENACPKFAAMYDIVRNTIDAPLVELNINVNFGFTEKKAYIELGQKLGFNKTASKAAYLYAKATKEVFEKEQKNIIEGQLKSNKLKIAVVSHYYNTFDEYVGAPVIRTLEKLGAEVIRVCNFGDRYKSLYTEFGIKTLYWTFGKELLGSVAYLKDKVDGIVLVSTFPCGPDSMINDVLRIEQRDTPMITLVFDELQGQTGIETRIESFIDILTFKRQEEQK